MLNMDARVPRFHGRILAKEDFPVARTTQIANTERSALLGGGQQCVCLRHIKMMQMKICYDGEKNLECFGVKMKLRKTETEKRKEMSIWVLRQGPRWP